MFSFVCAAAKIKKNKEERIKNKQGVRFADKIKKSSPQAIPCLLFLIYSLFFLLYYAFVDICSSKKNLTKHEYSPLDGA